MEIWLKEKQVGHNWVFPVLNDTGNRIDITLVITVGALATKADKIVPIRGESIFVEAFDVDGSALEQLRRPDLGELTIRGGPSLQSTAAFSFAPSKSKLHQLKVTIGNANAIFNVQERRRQLKLPSDPPEVHDEYPIRPIPEGILDNILETILSFLRAIGKFFKQIFGDKCCVNTFNCPDNRIIVGKSDRFEMNANFQASGGDCSCPCCEYRQYVRGAFRDAAGAVIPFALPDGAFSETMFREDGIPNQWGPEQHDFYGHREQTHHINDDYLPNRPDGCQYRGNDTVRCGAMETLHAEFIGLIVDVCRGEIVAVRHWIVNL